ncbi:hypothetical protein GCK72_022671 [Caenorhabditis remanei]|uniref:Tudor-knot domain-containing protein n=1 Tax=Caenorhabditis remanei TaxID=31234 RepID=A0A6A5FUB9_CAERE|nr:hypothetical protein GCK72_022671 [Caenorhabditis remanei]KAF1746218.1 hypothetical protein GCK72_022671 [Caenorhabditis remanei]
MDLVLNNIQLSKNPTVAPDEEERPRFEIGKMCICRHKGRKYRAKIVGERVVDGILHFVVYYVECNARYDEVIPTDSPRLMKNNA